MFIALISVVVSVLLLAECFSFRGLFSSTGESRNDPQAA